MLMTQVIDAGEVEPRPIRWGRWHVQVLIEAVEAEGGEWKDAFGEAGWTFTEWHGFIDLADGEKFVVKPGDRIRWWWS